jgi:hypothetical protein
MFEGEVGTRFELFDEDDLDAAIARFDELKQQPPQLENGATRQNMQLVATFNRRDPEGYFGNFTAHAQFDDRRKGLRYEGHLDAEFLRGLFTDEAERWRLDVEPIAIRGDPSRLPTMNFRRLHSSTSTIVA